MLKFRIIDKTADEYDLYSEAFNSVFDAKYAINESVAGVVNPFRSKDNMYVSVELAGAIIGGANIVFLNESYFSSLRFGHIVDDMSMPLSAVSLLSVGDCVYAYISSVFIKQAYWGKGYALKLLRECERIVARRAGVREVIWLALCINERSVRLHIKFGMKDLGVNSVGDHILFKVTQVNRGMCEDGS